MLAGKIVKAINISWKSRKSNQVTSCVKQMKPYSTFITSLRKLGLGSLYTQNLPWRELLLGVLAGLYFSGCASSDVQRDAAANVDFGVQNAKNLVEGAGDGDIADSYQNASQTSKGIMLGAAAGAVTGAFLPAAGPLAGAAAGAIFGGSYGSYIDSNTSLKDRLINRGANIIVLGDQILIVLPSWRIFEPLTATVKTQSYSTLNLLAQYINLYTKTLVKVSAYTAASGSSRVDRSLSQLQAEHVAKFLQGYGVDARLLYAAGYGGSRLVQRNLFKWDGNDNYRIEITLEKLYV